MERVQLVRPVRCSLYGNLHHLLSLGDGRGGRAALEGAAETETDSVTRGPVPSGSHQAPGGCLHAVDGPLASFWGDEVFVLVKYIFHTA